MVKINYKNLTCLILLINIILVSFGGCENTTAQLNNYIDAKNLTQEQKQVVELISTDKFQIIMFDFTTEEIYKTRDFWIETYKRGELIDSRAAGITTMNDNGEALSGEIAVTINQTPEYQWTFIYTEKNGTKASNISEFNSNYVSGVNAYYIINHPIEIEDGEEIVLYASLFNKDGKIHDIDNLQNLVDKNYLEEYEYAHIIKCRFLK
ncbi:MAG: hypothetical protein K0R92_2519 [Lachnospiraceae bacterium]|nr:hypothetical protein [Lachnospiraceae bacterium]